MNSKEIRQLFCNQFLKNGHDKISSSSLVPHNDPTLLFTNAGMNQFKDYFTGKAKPTNRRAISIQKCVRAGGKHNDLENVGFTARHHTFFEMLGNFSFGDYFKKDAIHFAWELLTKDLKIPKEKLYITVFRTDDEAIDIWHKQEGIPLDRIIKRDEKDNFWEMGDIGPCGPCSEIFVDHGEKYSTPNFKPAPGQTFLDDETRYVEIWNLVFMQYEKFYEDAATKKVKQISLPKPSIDTGAGLERIAAFMQGKYWNYDSDLFSPIVNKIEAISNKAYSDSKYTSNMRVIADHIRSATMLITDGVIPSNEGRGYVLRRIIRRAIRHLRELEVKDLSFYKLVPTVFDLLGEEYPQNKNNASLAIKLLEIEEKKFLETLDIGMKFLNQAIDTDLVSKTLPGPIAFKLYDTYGFPLDLTEVILKEKNLNLDHAGFESSMQKQKEASKKSWKGGDYAGSDKIFNELKEKFGNSEFVGYEKNKITSKLLAKVDMGEVTGLLFDSTPFYAESGGQFGDRGTIGQNGFVLSHVQDTRKPVDGLFIHYSVDADALKENENYELEIASDVRSAAAKNHSATHLLQAALIQVLGSHIKQAGSLVTNEKLRFDFAHHESISKEKLKEIENLVNAKIQESISVQTKVTSLEDATKLGALAFFGEKYGSSVRMLKMGDFSTELCGGTHVKNTSDINHFSIISESAISSGVRRIEAITDKAAIARLMSRSNTLEEVENIFSVKSNLVVDKMNSLLTEKKELEKQINSLQDKLDNIESEKLFLNPTTLKNGALFFSSEVGTSSDLKKLGEIFATKFSNGICVLFQKVDGKVNVLLRATKNVATLDCGKILKETLPIIGGKGGGRPDQAQGSGSQVNDLPKFLAEVKATIESKA